MKKPVKIILNAAAGIGLLVGGYFVGKRTNRPKRSSGKLVIDHREDYDHPDIYFADIDDRLFYSDHPVIFELVHIRK